jgi:hypothetical protein
MAAKMGMLTGLAIAGERRSFAAPGELSLR